MVMPDKGESVQTSQVGTEKVSCETYSGGPRRFQLEPIAHGIVATQQDC